MGDSDEIRMIRAVALGAPEAEWDALEVVAARWLLEHDVPLTKDERDALRARLEDA